MFYSPVHKAISSVLCIAFALGILLQYHINVSYDFIIKTLLLSIFSLFILQLLHITKYTISNSIFLSLAILLGLSLGAFRLNTTYAIPNFESIPSSEYVATVQKIPLERENTYRVELIIDSIYSDTSLQKSDIKLIAYLEKSSEVLYLRPGQVIYFQGRLEAVNGALNPEGFDYRKYLSHQNTFATAYIPQDKWRFSNRQNPSLKTRAANAQYTVVSRLSQLPFGQQEFAVLSALTVGYKQFIEDDQRKAYAASGATHILAVSGLHVGILFIFLSRLLKFWGKSKFSIYLRTLVIVILLWCFAFISGLSPSVCRATLMFSCISIGLAHKRKTNIFNIVFISALILLIINPLNIFSLGFQLSYSAVIGILTFEPIFESILYEKWHIYKGLSELIAVSIAAQLGTFPIAIHTFNTFPLYFLLTNIWIIPMVTVILNIAIILIALCLTNIPCLLLAKFLNLLLLVMNKGVNFISNLPNAQISKLYLSNIEVILTYALILMLALAVIYHSKQLLSGALLSLLLLPANSFYHSYQEKDNHNMYCFYDKVKFNLCLQQGNTAMYYSDTITTLPDYLIHHRLKGSFLSREPLKTSKKNNHWIKTEDFLITKQQIFAFYSEKLESCKGNISINTLIINQEYPINLYQLYEKIVFDELLLFEKPSNSFYYSNFCENKNIKLHIIKQDGAYSKSLGSEASIALASSN